MNYRQGLFRLWIVASVVWVGGVLVAEWRQERFLDKLDRSSTRGGYEVYVYTKEGHTLPGPPILLAFGPPAAAFALGLAGLWAAKGFKDPKE
jgi:hypothetical protein